MTAKSEALIVKHYGVKGMHWGVRKDRKGRPESSDSKKVSELRKRKPKQLSNKQLKTVNERLQAETKFRQLNPSTVERGHAAAKTALAVATTAASLYALSTTPLGKKLIEKGRRNTFKQLKLPGM